MTTETKTPEIPNCPDCEEPLTEMYGQVKYHITFKDGKWHKEEGASKLVCGKCYGELDPEDVGEIMKVGLL